MRQTASKKWLIAFIVFLITLRVASTPTANASFFLVAGFALLGRAQAIQALTLSWLFTMINPALGAEASAASIGRYVVILAAAVSVAWCGIKESTGFFIKRFSFLTICLGIIILVHSLMFSAAVDVSVLKASSWTVAVVTLLSAWQGLSSAERLSLFDQIQSTLIFLIFLSLFVLAIPSVGYLRNGTGFQGVLNHPQAFGPMVALVGVIAGGRVLNNMRPAWKDIALLGTSLVLIVLSEARTAGVAMVMGLLGSALFSPIFAGLSHRQMLPGLRSRRVLFVSLLLTAGIILAWPFLSDKLSSYLFKRSEASNLITAADASRGILVDRMVKNISENPWTGIGFGVASSVEVMVIERDKTFGIPLSAAVEKGVMPIAIIEELGIICALAILAWFFIALRKGALSGVLQFSVLLTTILVNFGESIFFSAGGMGMLLLILFTGGLATGPTMSARSTNA